MFFVTAGCQTKNRSKLPMKRMKRKIQRYSQCRFIVLLTWTRILYRLVIYTFCISRNRWHRFMYHILCYVLTWISMIRKINWILKIIFDGIKHEWIIWNDNLKLVKTCWFGKKLQQWKLHSQAIAIYIQQNFESWGATTATIYQQLGLIS